MLPQSSKDNDKTNLFSSNSLFGNANTTSLRTTDPISNLPKDTEIKTKDQIIISSNPNETIKKPESKTIKNVSNKDITTTLIKPNEPNSITQITGMNDSAQIQTDSKEVKSNDALSNLISASRNYLKIKLVIGSFVGINQDYYNKLEVTLKEKITQTTNEEHINETTNFFLGLLEELFKSKKENEYLFTINSICQLLIIKCEQYKDDNSMFNYYLAKIISALSSRHTLFKDVFISMMTFKCPYVIPKFFKRQDFNSIEEYLKAIGMCKDETFNDFLSHMESYSFLYFSFILQNKNLFYLAKTFWDSINNEEKTVYPMGGVVFSFLNILGEKIRKENPQTYISIIKKFQDHLVKLTAMKNSINDPKLKALKDQIAKSIFQIKDICNTILKNNPTDFTKNLEIKEKR